MMNQIKQQHSGTEIQIVLPPGSIRHEVLEFMTRRGISLMHLPSEAEDLGEDLPTYTVDRGEPRY